MVRVMVRVGVGVRVRVGIRVRVRVRVRVGIRVRVRVSRLGDGERLVQVAQRVELPLLTLYHDVELLDTVEGQLVALDQDLHRLAHELARQLEHVRGHGGREEADVDLG